MAGLDRGLMMDKKIWTVLELLQWAGQDFKARGIETPRLDAELLLARALQCERIDLYLRYDQPVTAEVLDVFREAIRRRRAGEPVAYITGCKYFHDIKLNVAPGVLIPRFETELLVDLTLEKAKEMKAQPLRLLDLCTGCGAVALALAHKLPEAVMVAADISPEALAAAKDNAARLGFGERVKFLQGDLFEPLKSEEAFDIIVGNPPYIPTAMIEGLMPEVRSYEPRVALDGGPEGLSIIDRILAAAPKYLRSPGWLLMEVGIGQADIITARPFQDLKSATVIKDYSGIKRVVAFSKE